MRQQTRELALASVLGALAVLFLFLGGVLPLALYACPLLASACLLPVREECRASYQWCCFFAAAILLDIVLSLSGARQGWFPSEAQGTAPWSPLSTTMLARIDWSLLASASVEIASVVGVARRSIPIVRVV